MSALNKFRSMAICKNRSGSENMIALNWLPMPHAASIISGHLRIIVNKASVFWKSIYSSQL